MNKDESPMSDAFSGLVHFFLEYVIGNLHALTSTEALHRSVVFVAVKHKDIIRLKSRNMARNSKGAL